MKKNVENNNRLENETEIEEEIEVIDEFQPKPGPSLDTSQQGKH